MMSESEPSDEENVPVTGAEPESGDDQRAVSPAAKRALEEAAVRRAERDSAAANEPKELGGKDGPDPARYGDWENGGIASDF